MHVDNSIEPEHLDAWLKKHGITKIISISGGSDIPNLEHFEPEAREVILKNTGEIMEIVIDEILGALRQYYVGILTGGTEGGIPETVARKAKYFANEQKKLGNQGFKVIGIMPENAKALGDDILDCKIVVKSSYGPAFFGDESALFAKVATGMAVIGGGTGTMIECAHALKINEKLLRKGLPPKPIVCLDIGMLTGFSTILPLIIRREEVRRKSIFVETTAQAAANRLIEKLELYDCHYDNL